jgi:Fe-S-cluster-containing dehydrogenase component
MDENRRQFLKTMGVVAASAGLAALPKSANASAESFSGYPDRYGVLVDTTLCIGLNCRRCEIACAKENNLPPIDKPPEDASVFEHERRTDAQTFMVVNRFENPDPQLPPIYVKKQCMHCDEPACASACLVRAFTKTPEGAVMYDPSVCIGCRYCMVACPFNIPAYEYSEPLHPRVRKCTLCFASRLKDGRRPACVEACPREVMTFGKRSELIDFARQKIAAHPDRYVNHVYGEHEAGGTCYMYLASVPFDQIGMRTDLGDTPYPELTRSYLSAAPLVMALWPLFFTGLFMFSKRRDASDHEQQKDHEQSGEERR